MRKTEWYLSIDEGRDVIEQDVSNQFDLIGWDLKKTFKLFLKSNPPLVEWLGPVPTEFSNLVDEIIQNNKLKKAINNLIIEKRNGIELYWGNKD